jgi:hypothetical protein
MGRDDSDYFLFYLLRAKLHSVHHHLRGYIPLTIIRRDVIYRGYTTNQFFFVFIGFFYSGRGDIPSTITQRDVIYRAYTHPHAYTPIHATQRDTYTAHYGSTINLQSPSSHGQPWFCMYNGPNGQHTTTRTVNRKCSSAPTTATPSFHTFLSPHPFFT